MSSEHCHEEEGCGLTLFFIGGVLGAAAGLLMAPKPGSETREQLGDWLKEKRRRARAAMEEDGEEELAD